MKWWILIASSEVAHIPQYCHGIYPAACRTSHLRTSSNKRGSYAFNANQPIISDEIKEFPQEVKTGQHCEEFLDPETQKLHVLLFCAQKNPKNLKGTKNRQKTKRLISDQKMPRKSKKGEDVAAQTQSCPFSPELSNNEFNAPKKNKKVPKRPKLGNCAIS